MSDEIAIQELPQLEAQAHALSARIPLIKIVDAESFALAVEDRAEVKRRLVRIGELMDPICGSTHTAWKMAVAKREMLRAPFVEADKAYSRGMGAYEQEQERLRRDAEEATRRERDRLEATERARVEAEARRLREAEETRRLDEAVIAEADGDSEAAERILSAPIETPVVVARLVFVAPPAVQAPRAAGVSFRDHWTAKCFDLDATIRAAATGNTAARSVLQYDQVAANKLAVGMKTLLDKSVPGVRAVNERIAPQRKEIG